MIGSLGFPEMMVLLALALVVFGPRRLPELAQTLGRAMGAFRRASEDFSATLEREVAREKVANPELQADGPAGEAGSTPRSLSAGAAEPGSGDPAAEPTGTEPSQPVATTPVRTEDEVAPPREPGGRA